MPSKGPARVLSAADLYSEHHHCRTSHPNNTGNGRVCKESQTSYSPPITANADQRHGRNRPHALACLWVFTPLAASLCLCVVLGALAGPMWLITVERMPNAAYNGSSPGPNQDEEGEGGAYLVKRTSSSLWVLCATDPGYLEYRCGSIEYFPVEEYSPDPNDSTQAIPYAVVRSSVFFFGSGVLLLSGYACCILGLCHKHRRVCTFAAGALYVISGLLMLIGLIVYISIFKAEVGGKLRPRSSLQPPMFTFRYGPGFLLYVFGFICAEIAGTAAVFLYTHRHAGEVAPCYRTGAGPYSPTRNKSSANHNAGNAGDVNPSSELDYLLIEHALRHPCKKHPPQAGQVQVVLPPTPPLPPPPPPLVCPERRFYFEPVGMPLSSCTIHRMQHHKPGLPTHLSTSMHDLGTLCGPPPPPPLIYGSARSLLARTQSLPRDASTNTPMSSMLVSPSMDTDEDFYSPGARHGYVTFDLDAPMPLRRTTPV